MDGKMAILAAVAKQRGSFRNRHIAADVGLDRRLIDYHLKKLVEGNLIMKEGPVYVVPDHDELINAMAAHGDYKAKTKQMPWATRIYSTTTNKPFTLFKEALEYIQFGRAMGLPDADLFKSEMLHQIDDTIASFKVARKVLTGASGTQRSWRSKMNDKTVDELTKNYHEWLTAFTDSKVKRLTIELAIGDAMEETDE